jgi:hypothetical protein
MTTAECKLVGGVPTVDRYGNYVCCSRLSNPGGGTRLGSCAAINDGLPHPGP